MNNNDEIDKILAAAGQLPEDTPESTTLNSEAVAQAQKQVAEIEEYENSGIEAGALGAARGLTFGFSDQILTKLGNLTGYTPEKLRNIKKYNETESLLGEAAGVVVPSLLTGGAGLAGSAAKGVTTGVRAAEAAGLATERMFAKVLAEQGKNSIAKSIVAKSIPKMLGSGVEGSLYGVGQLVSEEALGNADFNAENLIASAGTGALLGGATRGIFEAPKLLAPVAKKMGAPIAKKASDFFDRPGAALELIGTTPIKAQKLANHRPDFVKELPDWLAEKAKLKPFSKTISTKKSIEEVRDLAAMDLASISKQIDDIVAKNSDTIPPASSYYLKIADAAQEAIDSKLIKGIGTSKLQQIRKSAIDAAESKVKTLDPASALELRSFKREIDDIIPYGTETSKIEVGKLKALRGVVDDGIKELASLADSVSGGSNLLEKYAQANKDYSYASIILPNLDSKLAKESSKGFLSFQDTILGGATVAAVGGNPAAVLIGAKKLAESDFRRRVVILSGIEKANRTVDTKIVKGIDSFFNQASKKAPALSASLSESTYALDKERKKPENNKKAFQNIHKRITELVANPEELERVITRRTLHLQDSAPATSSFAVQTALKGLEFLNAKLPKQASALSGANQFAKREYEPSQLEVSKFQRYLEAVENPLSALDQLESGTLTREAAEAIKTVYPQMFLKMQDKVVDKLQSTEKPLSYNKRLQLGILLDLETDISLQNANIASLQANLAPIDPEATGGSTAARADSLNMAERQETKQNQLSQR